jgi:hypothetical protein
MAYSNRALNGEACRVGNPARVVAHGADDLHQRSTAKAARGQNAHSNNYIDGVETAA